MERLAFLRTRSGPKLQELSKQTGISVSEPSRLENNGRPVSEWHKISLARAFGIDAPALQKIMDFHGFLSERPSASAST